VVLTIRSFFALAGLALAVAMVSAACQPLAHGEYVRRLETTFPVLSSLHVTEFRDQDWCVNLAYSRGSYSKTNSHSTCDLFPAAPFEFDEVATNDLKELRDAFHTAGVEPIFGEIDWSSDGRIKSAYFEIGCAGCSIARYIYNASGVQIGDSPGAGTVETRVSDNWSWYVEH
jgi:hypothetical protein